jgi:hypothetical protein
VPISEIGVRKPRAEKAPEPRRYNTPPASRRRPAVPQSYYYTVSFRRIFLALLGAAAVAAFVTNQYQVRTEATIMARHWEAKLQTVATSSTIHSNTMSYEQEVNRINGNN